MQKISYLYLDKYSNYPHCYRYHYKIVVLKFTHCFYYYHFYLLASGRSADPGQVPGEEGGTQGALREGAPGGLLPGQILG